MVIYVPTTSGSRTITANEAIARLMDANIRIHQVLRVLHGMYVTSYHELVTELIIEIDLDATPDQICRLFQQETVLAFDDHGAYLMNEQGQRVLSFAACREQTCNSIEEAVALQKTWAKHYGGATRMGCQVWAYEGGI